MKDLLNIRTWACGLIMVMCLASVSLAGDWWDGGSDDPTDTIKVTRNETGNVQSASHTNWQEGYIEVMAGATADTRHTVSQAHAYAVALKTARHLAYEKLAETVRGLHLSSNALYDRELLLDSNLRTELTALIRNARVIKEENHEFGDGSLWVEVTLGLNLYGEENAVILPALTWQKKRISRQTQAVATPKKERQVSSNDTGKNVKRQKRAEEQINNEIPAAKDTEPVIVVVAEPPVKVVENNTGTNLINGNPEESTGKKAVPTRGKAEPATGLIVDARGLDAQPAMLPRILSEDGSVLYSGQDVSAAYLRKIGLMGYSNSLDGARRLERAGDNPLVVNALTTAGRYHADFVLSRQDADLIGKLSEKNHFLEQCRVVVVLGTKPEKASGETGKNESK